MPPQRFSFRKSMRFGPLEVATAVASVVMIVGGVLADWAENSAHDRLIRDGHCVVAQVIDASSFTSQWLGRSGHLTYVLDERRYDALLHYDADDRLTAGTAVPICVAAGDPRTFVVAEDAWSGESANLWLRGLISIPVALVGLLILLIFARLHQWRFHDGDETPTARWSRSQRHVRHLSGPVTSPLTVARDLAVLLAIGLAGAALTHLILGQEWTSPASIGITAAVFLAAAATRIVTALLSLIRRLRSEPPVDPAQHNGASEPDN